MTLSLAGRCAETGMVGGVITTSSPCVGARCLWVRAQSGVVLTQNVTNPALARLSPTCGFKFCRPERDFLW